MPHTPRSLASPLVFLFGLLAGLALAARAPAATVSIVPADTTLSVGDTFTIRAELDSVPDLKAFHLVFGFDPRVVQFLGATAGDVLTGTGRPYSMFVLRDHVAPVDTAGVDCAELVGTTSGPGVAAYFRFRALAPGGTPIRCLGADLRNVRNQRTTPKCGPGRVRVIAPVPARPVHADSAESTAH
jgi:hypothetical protein